MLGLKTMTLSSIGASQHVLEANENTFQTNHTFQGQTKKLHWARTLYFEVIWCHTVLLTNFFEYFCHFYNNFLGYKPSNWGIKLLRHHGAKFWGQALMFSNPDKILWDKNYLLSSQKHVFKTEPNFSWLETSR